jgi:hypothetical protein
MKGESSKAFITNTERLFFHKKLISISDLFILVDVDMPIN